MHVTQVLNFVKIIVRGYWRVYLYRFARIVIKFLFHLLGAIHPSIYKNGKPSYGSNQRNPKSFDGGTPYQNSLKRTISSKIKDNTLGLFDIIHSKFVELGQGYHGAPVYYFQYHMEDARWIHIQPMALGKVVVSNTCPQVI